MLNRHLADKARTPSRRRIQQFLKIERGLESRPDRGEAFRAAHKAGTGARLRAFMRIERGLRA